VNFGNKTAETGTETELGYLPSSGLDVSILILLKLIENDTGLLSFGTWSMHY
jgi:hypothetical protein